MYPREKQFANLLTKQSRRWQYPTRRFNLGNTTYRPDFFLPKENLYIEVIGTRQAYHAHKDKIIEFQKLYPDIRLIIVDPNNNPFPRIKPKKIFKVKVKRFKKLPSIPVKIPIDSYFKVKDKAKQEGKLILDIMQEVLEDYVKKHNKRK